MAKKPETGPSARLIKVGEILMKGEEKFVGRAMVKAGYSPTTARVPKEHGVTAEKAIVAYKKASLARESDLERAAQAAGALFDEVVRDERAPMNMRLAAAKVAAEMSHKQRMDLGVGDETAIDPSEVVRYRASYLRAIQKGILLALVDPEKAARVADRLGRKLEKLAEIMEGLSGG